MHSGNRERSLLLAILVSIELTPIAAAHLGALNLIALNLL
jgi:hypothetical protein